MSHPIIFTIHSLQAALSAYGLYLCYVSGTDLHKYEDKAERAAKYSDTAGHELHKTRVTQASGAAAVLTSLLTTLPSILSSSEPTYPKLALNVLNVVTCLAARQHIANYWTGKAKVPFVDGYNEGIKFTNSIKQTLLVLAGSWAVTSLMGAGVLFGR